MKRALTPVADTALRTTQLKQNQAELRAEIARLDAEAVWNERLVLLVAGVLIVAVLVFTFWQLHVIYGDAARIPAAPISAASVSVAVDLAIPDAAPAAGRAPETLRRAGPGGALFPIGG